MIVLKVSIYLVMYIITNSLHNMVNTDSKLPYALLPYYNEYQYTSNHQI